jgi:hypothetical protein
MTKFLRSLLGPLLLIGALSPGLAHAQAVSAVVVSACGTPPITYTAGKPYPITQDTTGTQCGGNSAVPVPDSPTSTGTIASNSDTVILTTSGGYSSFGVTVTGNGSGAMQVSGSRDCTNYSVTTALPLANGIASSAISANGSYQGNMASLKCIKIAGLSIATGTYTITLSAGTGIGPVMQDNIPWVIGGYSTGSSSTGVAGTVKSASTAPAAADTSLVVGLSPNGNLVGGYEFNASVIPTVQNASYAAGQSLGGLQTISIGSTNSLTGILDQIQLSSKGGSVVAMVVYIWDKNPASTTCTDKTNFVASQTDDQHLITMPVLLTPALSVSAQDTGTRALASNLTANFINSSSNTDLYVCILANATVTPATTTDLRLNIQGIKDQS